MRELCSTRLIVLMFLLFVVPASTSLAQDLASQLAGQWQRTEYRDNPGDPDPSYDFEMSIKPKGRGNSGQISFVVSGKSYNCSYEISDIQTTTGAALSITISGSSPFSPTRAEYRLSWESSNDLLFESGLISFRGKMYTALHRFKRASKSNQQPGRDQEPPSVTHGGKSLLEAIAGQQVELEYRVIDPSAALGADLTLAVKPRGSGKWTYQLPIATVWEIDGFSTFVIGAANKRRPEVTSKPHRGQRLFADDTSVTFIEFDDSVSARTLHLFTLDPSQNVRTKNFKIKTLVHTNAMSADDERNKRVAEFSFSEPQPLIKRICRQGIASRLDEQVVQHAIWLATDRKTAERWLSRRRMTPEQIEQAEALLSQSRQQLQDGQTELEAYEAPVTQFGTLTLAEALSQRLARAWINPVPEGTAFGRELRSSALLVSRTKKDARMTLKMEPGLYEVPGKKLGSTQALIWVSEARERASVLKPAYAKGNPPDVPGRRAQIQVLSGKLTSKPFSIRFDSSNPPQLVSLDQNQQGGELSAEQKEKVLAFLNELGHRLPSGNAQALLSPRFHEQVASTGIADSNFDSKKMTARRAFAEWFHKQRGSDLMTANDRFAGRWLYSGRHQKSTEDLIAHWSLTLGWSGSRDRLRPIYEKLLPELKPYIEGYSSNVKDSHYIDIELRRDGTGFRYLPAAPGLDQIAIPVEWSWDGTVLRVDPIKDWRSIAIDPAKLSALVDQLIQFILARNDGPVRSGEDWEKASRKEIEEHIRLWIFNNTLGYLQSQYPKLVTPKLKDAGLERSIYGPRAYPHQLDDSYWFRINRDGELLAADRENKSALLQRQ